MLIEQIITRYQGLVGYVEPGFQGKEIGKKIMNCLINYAKERGCNKIILNCCSSNVGFYEEFGFKTHDTMIRRDL